MKTAVEWFFEQIMYADVDIKVWREIYDQAKEMEKEQIMQAFEAAEKDCGKDFLHGDLYYNETFKSE
jgi:hypothetical protein